MNLLYVHSHDTGRFIQPYGHAARTPKLQAFAEQSVLFRNAHCVTPTCSPSRSALLTGTFPHQNGMNGLAHRGFSLNDYSQHILHRFKSLGHTAILSGIQHIAGQGSSAAPGMEPWQRIGYDACLGGSENADTQTIAWLEQNRETPFFLSVGFCETHREFPRDDELTVNPDYVRVPPGLPDTAENRRDMAAYLSMAEILDRKMGAVFDALDRLDLARNTIVIVTTDHGIAFPRHKCNLEDTGTGVMLMLRAPMLEDARQPRAIDAQVTHLDIYPTLRDIFGFEVRHRLEGKSLLPLLRGEVDQLHDAIFSEVSVHAAEEPIRAVRTGRWKYIRRYGDFPLPVLCNCDNSPSKQTWLDAGWAGREPAREALYDLVFDPMESNNLAADPAHLAVLDDLRARLHAHQEATADPLLSSPRMPLPPGVRLNPQTDLSPLLKSN